MGGAVRGIKKRFRGGSKVCLVDYRVGYLISDYLKMAQVWSFPPAYLVCPHRLIARARIPLFLHMFFFTLKTAVWLLALSCLRPVLRHMNFPILQEFYIDTFQFL